jgi:hypothetical protein
VQEIKQVEPFIPPTRCRLLITSRQYFTLPGLFPKRHDSLPPADARKLLLTIAPRIGELAGEIARLFGYLPFALRLAASVIAERPNINPADYTQQLSFRIASMKRRPWRYGKWETRGRGRCWER